MNSVISVEHLSKQYDLGVVGTGSLVRDFERWWARVRKQPDPYTRIGHEDAFKRRGETILALDDVSFTVQQGEALGIIGKNGSGKSTLLKILSRVTAPSKGVVKAKGRIGSLLEVGTGFHPELTGRENVYLNGAILGMKRVEVDRKFDQIVDFSGVEQFIDTPVKRYSSGMHVRLGFAVAAHLDPEILIVDEVLAVGDAEFQKKCLAKMNTFAGEGRTVLFVSHNMISIQKLCSRSICLQAGIITQDGITSDVIRNYLHVEEDSSKYISLDSRKDRKGDQTLHFTHVDILDKNYHKVDYVISGQDVHFRFFYCSKLAARSQDVCVSFVVNDQEYPLSNINSVDRGQNWMDLFEEGYFECVWPNFNLTSRSYSCSLFCSINGNIADWVESAFSLEVIDGDFYNSGEKIGFQSKFLVIHNWRSLPSHENNF